MKKYPGSTIKAIAAILFLLFLVTSMNFSAAAAPSDKPDSAAEISLTQSYPYKSDNLIMSDPITLDQIPSDGPVADEGTPAAQRKVTDPDREKAATSAGRSSYIPLVVIVIGFNGLPYSNDYDWNKYYFSGKQSVMQYYNDMSYNQFTFKPVKEKSAYGVGGNTNTADRANDGVIHVTLSRQKQLGWAVSDDTVREFSEISHALFEAVTRASSYFDFSQYDSNADGTLQNNELAVCFSIAGYSAASYQEKIPVRSQYLFTWPHHYTFRSDVFYMNIGKAKVNGVALTNYVMVTENEKHYSNTKAIQSSLGMAAHELGHLLGLPDLYSKADDGAWSDYNVSYLSLMCSGSYGIDRERKPLSFSLDMWSRVRLGWVDVKTLSHGGETESQIAGSLTVPTNDRPVALRINTENKGEYYLIENRRFTSWDAGMSLRYPKTATDGSQYGDYGGGLIFWHVDDNTLDYYDKENIKVINNYDIHPSVIPLFKEKTNGADTLIGTSVSSSDPFFDADSWGDTMFLPMYGKYAYDQPSDRTQTSRLAVSLDTGSAPVMKIHLHQFSDPTVIWADDHSSATLWYICEHCHKSVKTETTKDIYMKVVKRPTSTEPGVICYIARFKEEAYSGSCYAESTAVPDLLGDVDGDGAVTILDATMIQRYEARIINFTKDELTRADVDGDGSVIILDATLIQRFIVGHTASDGIARPLAS